MSNNDKNLEVVRRNKIKNITDKIIHLEKLVSDINDTFINEKTERTEIEEVGMNLVDENLDLAISVLTAMYYSIQVRRLTTLN
jgi:hypothetical protein